MCIHRIYIYTWWSFCRTYATKHTVLHYMLWIIVTKKHGLVIAVQRIIMGNNPIYTAAMHLCPSHRSRHISRVLGVVQLMYVGCCSKGLLV